MDTVKDKVALLPIPVDPAGGHRYRGSTKPCELKVVGPGLRVRAHRLADG